MRAVRDGVTNGDTYSYREVVAHNQHTRHQQTTPISNKKSPHIAGLVNSTALSSNAAEPRTSLLSFA
jgi:hypothetical protein